MTLTTIEKLLIIRRRLGLTAPQAARRWRLNVRTLHSWEQGTNRPTLTNVGRLARIADREESKMRAIEARSLDLRTHEDFRHAV